METGDGWDEWAHGKALIKPPDQLELTEGVSGCGSSLLNFKYIHMGCVEGVGSGVCCCRFVIFPN